MVPGGCGSLFAMTFTTCHVTISLDGFLAGADQSLEEPLGVGGERLHELDVPPPTTAPSWKTPPPPTPRQAARGVP